MTLFSVSLAVLPTGTALADAAGATLSEGDTFSEKTGEAIYSSVCQACHMPEGAGAAVFDIAVPAPGPIRI